MAQAVESRYLLGMPAIRMIEFAGPEFEFSPRPLFKAISKWLKEEGNDVQFQSVDFEWQNADERYLAYVYYYVTAE